MEHRLSLRMIGAALVAALLLFASSASGAERTLIDPGDSPSMGPPDAPVRIIEFVDYQ